MNLTTENLEKSVCEYYRLTINDLSSNSRIREIAFARMVYCYLLRKNTKLGLAKIGFLINRDHSSVFHLIEHMKKKMRNSVEVQNAVKSIERYAMAKNIVIENIDLLELCKNG